MSEDAVGEYFQKRGYKKKEGHYLDVEKVIQIFAMLSCEVPVYHIGAHFGVSSMMVYHIKNGARWGWVRDKLLEEAESERYQHRWIPDVKREGKFLCQDCAMRFDEIMMKTKCPVRLDKGQEPIYMSWKIPEPPKPKPGKRSIPAADLPKVRAYKKKVSKLQAQQEMKKAQKRRREAEKEARRQAVLRDLEALRIHNAMRLIERGENSSVRP